MRPLSLTIRRLRIAITLVLVAVILATPLSGRADEATPVATEEPAALIPGGLQISLSGSNGVPLSGSFGLADSAGTYQEVWASGGFATAWNLVGHVSVSQLTGTPDYAPDYTPRSVDIVPGGSVSLSFVNRFLDADQDGIGDSADACPGGNDTVDTDGDGTADSCDNTPDGDSEDNAANACSSGEDADACDASVAGEAPTPEPTVDSTVPPTAEPTEAPTENVADLTLEVDEEPVVVASAPVSCEQAEAVSPWLTSDLDDYPPGGLVTLSGGGWVPGQTIEILVEDDGIADAEQGEWTYQVTVTADETGAFAHAFTIAPWFVADYTVVATGECTKAETSFTDSVQGGNCVQVTASDVVAPGSYIMFRCASTQNPIRISVTSISAGWQWAYVFSSDPNLAPPLYSALNWQTTGTAGDSSASGNINQAHFLPQPDHLGAPGKHRNGVGPGQAP